MKRLATKTYIICNHESTPPDYAFGMVVVEDEQLRFIFSEIKKARTQIIEKHGMEELSYDDVIIDCPTNLALTYFNREELEIFRCNDKFSEFLDHYEFPGAIYCLEGVLTSCIGRSITECGRKAENNQLIFNREWEYTWQAKTPQGTLLNDHGWVWEGDLKDELEEE